MRILRVVHRLYPPTVGGLSFYADMLSTEQARAGHEVVVLTTQEAGYPKHERKDGYEIWRFKPVLRPLNNPITVGLLPSLLLSDKFDILHAHSHLMFTTILAAIKRHQSAKPFVITNHGFRVKRGRLLDYAQNAYLSSLGRFSLTKADCVISFTEAERSRTISAGVAPNKATVIPNGVDTKFFRPTKMQRIPHSVLWTGRYVSEKGLPYLMEAARIVSNHFPDSKFILVGDGPERGDLAGLRDGLKLGGSVLFEPEMNQRGILSLLNRCTMFALPSLSEGFPSSVLEAMSCERPVVVTGGIGMEEVVGNAGLYVPPRNPAALAEAIEKLLRDEGLAGELGERGRSRAVSLYDWQQIVPEINELFERVIDSVTPGKS